jgi:preprotein translocase subunit SecE
VNRETKRMMQRQGQMEADGSPATRKAPAGSTTGGQRQPRARQQGRKRTTPVQFVREVRDEMRQVAWPSRSELINYTSVVLTTLIIMISLIFVLNLAFGKLITLLFTK